MSFLCSARNGVWHQNARIFQWKIANFSKLRYFSVRIAYKMRDLSEKFHIKHLNDKRKYFARNQSDHAIDIIFWLEINFALWMHSTIKVNWFLCTRNGFSISTIWNRKLFTAAVVLNWCWNVIRAPIEQTTSVCLCVACCHWTNVISFSTHSQIWRLTKRWQPPRKRLVGVIFHFQYMRARQYVHATRNLSVQFSYWRRVVLLVA